MKIKREALISALKKVEPALEGKNMLEGIAEFAFDEKSIISFNDILLVQYPFKTDLKCSVPANEFYKLLDSISDNEIDLSLVKGKLMLRAKNIKAQINCNIVSDKIEDVKKKILFTGVKSILPTDFREGLDACLFSAAVDTSKPILNCLYVNGRKIISSDNIRISEYTLKKKVKDNFLIPRKAVKEIVNFDIKKYWLANNMIHFDTSEGAIVSSILHFGEYYKTEKFFDIDGKDFIFPKDMKKMLPAVNVMADDAFLESNRFKFIEIEIENNRLTCTGRKDIGSVTTEFKVKTKIKNKVSFKIRIEVFRQILEYTNKVKIGDRKVLFELDNFKHVAALIR